MKETTKNCHSTDILALFCGEKGSGITDPWRPLSWVGHGPPYGGISLAYGFIASFVFVH